MKRYVAVALFLLLVSSASALTEAERVSIWTRSWETVRRHFTGFDETRAAAWDVAFEPGLRALGGAGSDLEFWIELRRRIASLDDGRTALQLPANLPRVYDTVPIRFMIAGRRVLVKQLSESPEILASGIRAGDELVTVNHVPVLEHLRRECLPDVSGSTEQGRMAEAVWRILRGPASESVHLVLKRPNGEEYSLSLRRDTGPGGSLLQDLGKVEGRFAKTFRGGVLYLEMGQRLTANSEQAALDQLAEHPKTKSLIIDLRDAKDGIVPTRLLQKLALFPLPMGGGREVYWVTNSSSGDPARSETTRQWRPVSPQTIEPDPEPFRGGVVLLVSAETAGPAEQFIEPLVFSDRAALIGDTTAGAGGKVIETPLGNGATLWVTSVEPRWENGYGAGKGFEPRVYAIPTPQGLAAGKDEVLEQALVFIRERAH